MKKLLSYTLILCMLISCTAGIVSVSAVSDAVQADYDALTVDDIITVPSLDPDSEAPILIDNLDLDVYTKGEVNESPIAWSSSPEGIISENGKIIRPDATTEVTLTATIGAEGDALTKDFKFTVPAATAGINGMPTVKEMKLDETFDDNDSSHFKAANLTEGVDSVNTDTIEVDKKIKLNRSKWTSGEPYLQVGLNADSTPTALSDDICAEFTVNTTSAGMRMILIDNQNWINSFRMDYYGSDNAVTVHTGETTTSIPKIGNKFKVTVATRSSDKTFSLWINNIPVLENLTIMKSGGYQLRNPSQIRFVALTTGDYYGVGDIIVDNVKLYEYNVNPATNDLVDIESSLVEGFTEEYNGKTYLMDNLNFAKTVGDSGSKISYISSDLNTITDDGTLVRGDVDKEVSVTVKASIDGSTYSKSFDYVVPGKYNKVGSGDSALNDDIIYTQSYNEQSATSDVKISGTDTSGNISDGAYLFKSTNINTGDYVADLKNGLNNNSGITVHEIVFETSFNSVQIYLGDEYGGWYGTSSAGLYFIKGKFYTTGNVALQGFDECGLNKKTRLTFVNNISTSKSNIYINGKLALSDVSNSPAWSSWKERLGSIRIIHKNGSWNNTLISGGAWYKGTTKIYSYNVYTLLDESALSSVMKSSETISPDKKSATVAVAAMDDTTGGNFIYAAYSADGSELLAIDIVDLTLDKFSHREYTAKLDKDIPADAVTKIFYFDSMDNIAPLTVGSFPVN